MLSISPQIYQYNSYPKNLTSLIKYESVDYISDDAFAGSLFVSNIEETNAAECTDQENHVEPTVVKVELEVT